MSIYFIHAEAILGNGCVAEKVGKVVIATNAVFALTQFWSDDSVEELTDQGIKVVIDKFEKVE
ncbi:hypothetical protein [Escherichia coli]|uniref:hypothetical protein n=1 Tax=Escherichia coli TaxID=562 RepID=UPI001F1D617B|nr:hypothetical protein [Escherichia coli]